MNPWGIIIIALGIILIYIGIKGNPHSVIKGLQSAYGKLPSDKPVQKKAAKTNTPTGAVGGVQLV